MDATDRALVNTLQGGIAITDRPFAAVAASLDLSEEAVVERIERLVADGILSRFGPLYDAERMGGAVTLAAIAVPEDRFEEVAERVNAHPEVAHNYAREHRFNMWFVVAAERPGRIAEVLDEIAAETGLDILDLPKEAEYFLRLRLDV